MAQQIDVEHERPATADAVVTLRPSAVAPSPRPRQAPSPIPLHPSHSKPPVDRKPMWDKDNVGFWLGVCVLLSLAFSIVYHALG